MIIEENSFLCCDEEAFPLKSQLPIKSTVTVYTEKDSHTAILGHWGRAPENDIAVQLSLDVDGEIFMATSERGFFFALQKLRKQLEAEGKLLAIMGSCRNVYPSPMMSDMGDGIFAYRLTPKRQALRKDVVNIFDPCERNQISTVAEQDAFYTNWLKSLGDN